MNSDDKTITDAKKLTSTKVLNGKACMGCEW